MKTLNDYLTEADFTNNNYFIVDDGEKVCFDAILCADLDCLNYELKYGGGLVSTEKPFDYYLYVSHDDFADLINRINNHSKK